jgi:hypothetical protein
MHFPIVYWGSVKSQLKTIAVIIKDIVLPT